MEAVARLRYYPELQKAVETLPPKLIVIGQTPATTLEYELNAPSRIAQVVESIEGAKFTGKGDQAKVSWLYRDYVARVTNMANSTGAAEACEYEGSRNASGQEEGRGISRYASGNTYEGEFKAGLLTASVCILTMSTSMARATRLPASGRPTRHMGMGASST